MNHSTSQNEIQYSNSFNDRLTPRHTILFAGKFYSARANTKSSSTASLSKTTFYRLNSNLEIENQHYEQLVFEDKKTIFKQFVVIDDELYAQLYIPAKGETSRANKLGARIKNEGEQIKKKIFEKGFKNGQLRSIKKQDNLRLILGYSDKRAA